MERLSCSLRTLPLSSLGQEHDAKKNKAEDRNKSAYYDYSVMVCLQWTQDGFGIGGIYSEAGKNKCSVAITVFIH